MKLRQLIIDHKNTLYFIKKTSRYNYIFLYFIWNHVTSVTCMKTKRQCSGSVRVNVFFAFVSLIHVLSNVFQHTDIANNHMSMLWSLECAFHLSCCLFVVSLYLFSWVLSSQSQSLFGGLVKSRLRSLYVFDLFESDWLF